MKVRWRGRGRGTVAGGRGGGRNDRGRREGNVGTEGHVPPNNPFEPLEARHVPTQETESQALTAPSRGVAGMRGGRGGTGNHGTRGQNRNVLENQMEEDLPLMHINLPNTDPQEVRNQGTNLQQGGNRNRPKLITSLDGVDTVESNPLGGSQVSRTRTSNANTSHESIVGQVSQALQNRVVQEEGNVVMEEDDKPPDPEAEMETMVEASMRSETAGKRSSDGPGKWLKKVRVEEEEV
ncbi:hypothetical protein J5N97_018525 [Dioscorea zingiberensis]|uniref:Uncharacterized protein n=1 Tax=Dioscorea zingiberensis TaxID=325984 RepID=A0A9D5CC27_9LILI|nr:hypothetical protein J5N97_018525 [Dioscorea zingiberensis]